MFQTIYLFPACNNSNPSLIDVNGSLWLINSSNISFLSKYFNTNSGMLSLLFHPSNNNRVRILFYKYFSIQNIFKKI